MPRTKQTFFYFSSKEKTLHNIEMGRKSRRLHFAKSKVRAKPVYITNTYSRQLVHKWRSEEQAILVGTQTVIDDNPKLDVRDWTGGNPVRIVLDQNSRLQQKSHVLDSQIKTIVLTKTKANTNKENLIFEVINFEKNIATQVTDVLYNQQIQSVIIEGGRLTLQTFIDANLWDEARIFKGTIDLKEGTAAPILSDSYLEKNTIGQDELIISINHD